MACKRVCTRTGRPKRNTPSSCKSDNSVIFLQSHLLDDLSDQKQLTASQRLANEATEKIRRKACSRPCSRLQIFHPLNADTVGLSNLVHQQKAVHMQKEGVFAVWDNINLFRPCMALFDAVSTCCPPNAWHARACFFINLHLDLLHSSPGT